MSAQLAVPRLLSEGSAWDDLERSCHWMDNNHIRIDGIDLTTMSPDLTQSPDASIAIQRTSSETVSSTTYSGNPSSSISLSNLRIDTDGNESPSGLASPASSTGSASSSGSFPHVFVGTSHSNPSSVRGPPRGGSSRLSNLWDTRGALSAGVTELNSVPMPTSASAEWPGAALSPSPVPHYSYTAVYLSGPLHSRTSGEFNPNPAARHSPATAARVSTEGKLPASGQFPLQHDLPDRSGWLAKSRSQHHSVGSLGVGSPSATQVTRKSISVSAPNVVMNGGGADVGSSPSHVSSSSSSRVVSKARLAPGASPAAMEAYLRLKAKREQAGTK